MNVIHVYPTKAEVKRLVNLGRWKTLGCIFNFTPVYHFGASNWIDWRCVPESLVTILRGKCASEIPKIKLKAVLRPRKEGDAAKPFRRILYDSQNGVCHYCKRMVEIKDWSIDHKLPYFRGGGNSFNNRIGSCKTCNHQKSCLTEEEFFLLLPGTSGISERCKSAVREIQKRQAFKPITSTPITKFGIGS